MTIWRNKVNIKHLMNDDESDEKVLEICNHLIPQLERIYNSEIKKCFLDKDWLEESYFEVIDNFKFVKKAIEDGDDAKKYSFESWCEAFFNEYLIELYDVGDTITIQRGFSDTEKFMWIG